MKILFVGDASSYHANLARVLRARGHQVCVASNGSYWMDTARDTDLRRRRGKIGGAWLYLKMLFSILPEMKGYDVVQLVSPGFVDLKPVRQLKIFKRLKNANGSIWLSALGTDANYVRALSAPNPPLQYSEWQINGKITPWSELPETAKKIWLSPMLTRYTDEFYDSIDGAITALYEYHRVLEATKPGLPIYYGGIPIDLDSLPVPDFTNSRPLRMLYAAHRRREGEKGSLFLLETMRRIAADFPDKVELITPPNVPYSQFINLLHGADIVSDQLYSYTPATTALLAMAMGAVSISGGEEEFYNFIGEKTLRPVINVRPDDPDMGYGQLRSLIENPELLLQKKIEGRRFVELHNDAALVATRFENAWMKNR